MVTERSKLGIVLAAAVIACGVGTAARAAVVANFTDGNGTTADGYVGAAGGGWSAAWADSLGNAPTPTNTVVNTTPLSGGDNYLAMSMTGSSTNATSTQNVYRTFTAASSGLDFTQPVEFKFDFRLDSSATARSQTDSLDKIAFIDSGSLGSSAAQTWAINSQGSSTSLNNHWTFSNGDRAGNTTGIDTSMAVVAGTVYHFDVLIHPGATAALTTWDASVSDGTNTFLQTNMGFRSSTAVTTSGRLQVFGSVNSKSEVLSYSLDSLSVSTPEPAALSLLAVAGGGLLRRRARRATHS